MQQFKNRPDILEFHLQAINSLVSDEWIESFLALYD